MTDYETAGQRLWREAMVDEPQPEYCDCDGFCTGVCHEREMERLRQIVKSNAEDRCHWLNEIERLRTALKKIKEMLTDIRWYDDPPWEDAHDVAAKALEKK